MIKTVTVNLAGQVFHIDENAFEKLSAYLKAIKNKYSAEEGCEEILSDIEGRIAEILFSKLKENGREVISIYDIEHIISILGKPEEFESKGLENEQSRTSSVDTKTFKRFFRNGDDKFFAGVCSGIAVYLGVNDPLWIRLFFILMVVAGFGTGILIYLVLWILVPEAETAAQKLQMKGEPVNLETIEKNFKEGAKNFEQRMVSLSEEGTFKSIAHRAVDLIKTLLNGVFRIIRGFLIFITAIIVFCVVAALMALAFSSIVSTPLLNDYLFESSTMGWVATVGVLLVFVVTSLFLVLLPFQIFSRNTRPFRKEVSITMGTLWLLGLIMALVGSSDAIKQFSMKESLNKTTVLENPALSDTLLIRTASLSQTNSKRVKISLGWKKYEFEEEGMLFNKVKMEIEPSEDSLMHLIENYRAHGANKKLASDNVNNIQYGYKINDNRLIFDDFYTFKSTGAKWRNQKVNLTLQIPEGTIIRFKDMEDFLEEVPMKDYEYFDKDLLENNVWIMKNGESVEIKPVKING